MPKWMPVSMNEVDIDRLKLQRSGVEKIGVGLSINTYRTGVDHMNVREICGACQCGYRYVPSVGPGQCAKPGPYSVSPSNLLNFTFLFRKSFVYVMNHFVIKADIHIR